VVDFDFGLSKDYRTSDQLKAAHPLISWQKFIDKVLSWEASFDSMPTDHQAAEFYKQFKTENFQKFCVTHHGKPIEIGSEGKEDAIAQKMWASVLYSIMRTPRSERELARYHFSDVVKRVAEGAAYYFGACQSMRI